MIYLMGMSHTINVAKAFSPEQFLISHDDWLINPSDTFYELQSSNADLAINKIATALLVGGVAQELNTDGKQEIKVSAQFLNLLKSIVNSSSSDLLVSVLGGNEHTILSMVQHPAPYDFILPTNPDMELIEGSQIVPFTTIENQIINSLAQTVLALRVIRTFHPNLPILHVISPPPIASQTQILAHLAHNDLFAQQIVKYGISPASLRLKYYLGCVSILSKEAERIGVSVLMPPDSSMDTKGYLAEDFWFASSHANVEYGKLVIEQINEYFLKREGK